MIKLISIIFCLFLSSHLFAAAEEEIEQDNVEEGYATPTDTYQAPTCPPALRRQINENVPEPTRILSVSIDEAEANTHPLSQYIFSDQAYEERMRYFRDSIRSENQIMEFEGEEEIPDSVWLPEIPDLPYLVGAYFKNDRKKKEIQRKIMRNIYGCRQEARFFNHFDRTQF